MVAGVDQGHPRGRHRARPPVRPVWAAALVTAVTLLIPATTLLGSAPQARTAPPAPSSPEATGPTGPTGTAPARTPMATHAPSRSKRPRPPSRRAAPTASRPSSNPVGTGGFNSGLPWASGAFLASDSRAALASFGAWRGRKMDLVVTYSARSNWSDIENPSWLISAWRSTNVLRVFGIPPFPENGSTLKACAAGSYNGHWRALARNLRASGYSGKTIIRLGWEFNGDWYAWRAADATAFARCWRQVVGAAETVAPALRWDWNVNRGRSSGLSDPTRAWPGSAYVDYVGVDSYDQWPGVTSESAWRQQLDGAQGLAYWARFARSHGKKLSVPEWGVYPGNAASNGGDNAFYIRKMVAWFGSLGSLLGYESYFNEPSGYIASSLHSPAQNPRAAAAYRSALARAG